MWVFHNDKIILEDEVKLTSRNRSFQYADGFFETIGFRNEEIRFLNDHISRIKRASKVFSYDLPPLLVKKEELTKTIYELIVKNELESGATVKIIVWRKEGGKYTPETNEVDFLIRVEKKEWSNDVPIVKNVDFYDGLVNTYNPVSSIKATSSTNYVLAGIQKKQKKLDEVILFGEDQSISECLYSNIVWFDNGVLHTPSYLTGCIDGIMRKQLLKECIKHTIPFQEGVYGVSDLLNADFVFTSNVSGFTIIDSLQEKKFNTESDLFDLITKELR